MKSMNVERQQVHSLVDKLPPSPLAALHSLLAAILDPVSRAIANAPIDDEPETDQERQAVAEADDWLKHHKPIPFERVLTDFGLTIEDLHQ